MEKHPLNPMTDPTSAAGCDLQTKGEVGLVATPTVRAGRDGDRRGVRRAGAAAGGSSSSTPISDDDLRAIGEAVAGHRLVTGGSGIALGLPENFRRAGPLAGTGRRLRAGARPGGRRPFRLVLAGIALAGRAYLRAHPGLAVDPDELRRAG